MTSRVLLRRALVVPVLLAALAACNDDDNGGGPGVGTFTLGAPATAELTLPRGAATTVTIPVTFTGSFSPVTLTADSVPAGVRVGFQPSTITNAYEQVTVSITVNPDAVIGTNTIKIVARAEDMTDQVARVTLTTTGVPSYTVASTVTATPLAIQRTQSGQFTVNITRNGFTGPLTFVAEGLPAGVTVPMVENVTGNTATITVNTAANASANTITFTLRATNPTIGDRVLSPRVTVVAEPGVQIAMANKSIQQGSPDTVFVTVNREGGFTGAVTVALTGLPAGVTAPATVNSASGSSVAIPLTISNGATTGNATISAAVSGTGIATKNVSATLTVVGNMLTSGTGITVADARTRGSWKLWRVTVPAGATSLRVRFLGGTGDGDIYIFNPSGGFVRGAEGVGNVEDVTIASPVAGVWFIEADVWDPYAGVTLTADVATTAPESLTQASVQYAPVTFRSARHAAGARIDIQR